MFGKCFDAVNDIAKSVEISRQGYKRVLSEHTYTVRMKHLLQAIKQ